MTDHDPLRHADIGETTTVQKTVTLHSINYTPSEFFGDDRFSSDIDADVEVLDGDGDGPDIQITWTGDITKRLPRNWDHHTEPVTDTEHREARRQKWQQLIVSVGVILAPILVSAAIATWVTNRLMENLTINGNPMRTTTPVLDAISLGAIVVLAALVAYTASGMFPGNAHGGHR